MKQLDVMIDLETLDTAPTAVIMSIAAVPFDINTGKIFDADIYYNSVDIDSCINEGFTISKDTLMVWFGFSNTSRHRVMKEQKNALGIINTLSHFANWFAELEKKYTENIYVWGNGSVFDISILRNAYKKIYNFEPPFDFRKIQDVRTIVRLAPEIKKNTKFEGTKHNPIDDCKHQIKYLTKIYQEKGLTSL